MKKLFIGGLLVLIIIAGLWSYQNNYFKKGPSQGVRINEMKIISIQPFNSGQYSKEPSLMETGPQNVKILLKGPVTVTGTYFEENNESGFSGYCMNNFNSEFLGKLPYDISNTKVKIFCFRNADFAHERLGTSTKKITVLIDNFEINFYPSEVVDWADLVDVKF